MHILIKKSQIAVSASDARPSRFVGGERIRFAPELNQEKRKVSLSMKLLVKYKIKAVSKFILLYLEKTYLFLLYLIIEKR